MSRVAFSLLQEATGIAAALPSPAPPFQYDVGFADSYAEVLAGSWDTSTTELDDVLDILRSRGRLIIHAEAGAGKTTLAARLLQRSLERTQPALWVDLRRWTPLIDEEWRALRGEDTQRMAVLLHEVARPPRSESELRRISRDHGVLVVVDGLNEVPRGVSRGILPVLDAFAMRNPQASVLVTDRLTRREFPDESEQWAIGGIADIRVHEMATKSAAGHGNALVTDLLLRTGPEHATTAEAIEAYFRSVGDIAANAMDTLALAGLTLYREGYGRTFPVAAFDREAGRELRDRLSAAALLLRDGDLAYFRHQLFHDFLAARAIASRPDSWTYATFNAISFKANAFDPFALVLEELKAPAASDAFVEAVYGWNQYASAYALARGRRLHSVSVTKSAELTILGMLAERRWDPFRATIDRVEDSLRLFRSDLAQALLSAKELEEVTWIIDQQEVSAASDAWRSVFLGEHPAHDLVNLLGTTPFLGWTAANVLRRDALTESMLRVVERICRDHPSTPARWQAAHALGAHPAVSAIETLMVRLDQDPDEWVRYGAVRSLIEIAARHHALRPEILESLRLRLEELRHHPLVLTELEKCLVLREPPVDWPDAVEPLVEDLWAMSESVFDQDHYRRVGQRILRAARAGARPSGPAVA